MRTFNYIFNQLSKELFLKKAGYSLGAFLCILLFLLSFQLFFVVRSQPKKATLKNSIGKRGEIAAQLENETTEKKINDLYLRLRKWEKISGIQLILAQEITEKYRLPKGFSSGSSIFLVDPSNGGPKLLNKLEGEKQISLATTLEEPIKTTRNLALPGWIKPMSLVAVLVFSLMALSLFYLLVTYVSTKWRGEFEILKYSGVKRSAVKLPVITYGILTGLAGSAFGIIILYVLTSWIKIGGWAQNSLPSLLDGSFVMGLALWSLLLGPVIGLSGILLGLDSIDERW